MQRYWPSHILGAADKSKGWAAGGGVLAAMKVAWPDEPAAASAPAADTQWLDRLEPGGWERGPAGRIWHGGSDQGVVVQRSAAQADDCKPVMLSGKPATQ